MQQNLWATTVYPFCELDSSDDPRIALMVVVAFRTAGIPLLAVLCYFLRGDRDRSTRGFKCFIKVDVFQSNKFKRNIAMNAQKKKNPGNKGARNCRALCFLMLMQQCGEPTTALSHGKKLKMATVEPFCLLHQLLKSFSSLHTSGLDDLDAILMEVELETRKKAVAAAAKSTRKSGKGQGANDKPPSAQTKSLTEQFEEEVRDLVPVDEQFPDGNFPVGEICEYTAKVDD
ncbi:unnamed protein product, partial [Wuchereria bancrofti]